MTDGVLLDASVCVHLLEGSSLAARARFERMPQRRLFTSVIVFAEAMLGATRLDRVPQTRALFTMLAILPFDEPAALAYGQLPFKRGSFDRLIAAHALSRGLAVATTNLRDFREIVGLAVEDWSIAP